MPTPTSPDARPRSLRDNWWWSGGLWLAGGGAIVFYQWPVIEDGTAFWGNYVMAVLGAAIAGVGAWRLWRDWGVHRATPAPEASSPPSEE